MKCTRFPRGLLGTLIEQQLGNTTPSELCKSYNISSGQLSSPRSEHAQGKPDPELSKEAELAARVSKRKHMLG